MTNVFVYGSLLFAEIAEGLCGQKLAAENAILKRFERFALKEADYPAIVPKQNSAVKGKVLLNLDDTALELLNFYEGDEYKVLSVQVETNSGITDAVVFVWIAGNEFLENFDWDKEQFESESLMFYCDEIVPATRNEYYERL